MSSGKISWNAFKLFRLYKNNSGTYIWNNYTDLIRIFSCCVRTVLLRVSEDQIHLKSKKSVFTFLLEEEFEFIGRVCNVFGKVMSQFPLQKILRYTIIVVLVE